MTQVLWPNKEAVREVFTEEVADELGLEGEEGWAGKQPVHRLRFTKGLPPVLWERGGLQRAEGGTWRQSVCRRAGVVEDEPEGLVGARW